MCVAPHKSFYPMWNTRRRIPTQHIPKDAYSRVMDRSRAGTYGIEARTMRWDGIATPENWFRYPSLARTEEHPNPKARSAHSPHLAILDLKGLGSPKSYPLKSVRQWTASRRVLLRDQVLAENIKSFTNYSLDFKRFKINFILGARNEYINTCTQCIELLRYDWIHLTTSLQK